MPATVLSPLSTKIDSINRPEYWKHQLSREEHELRLVLEEEGLERVVGRSAPLERFAFVTAYIMRKLAEGDALTVEVTRSSLPVRRFECVREPPPRKWFEISEDGKVWRQPIEQHYDLEHPRGESLRFDKLCNYLIHHFAFETRFSEGRPEILFNSEETSGRRHDRKGRLYAIALDDYRRLVSEVVSDEIQWVDMDRSTGKVIQRRTDPPGWS